MTQSQFSNASNRRRRNGSSGGRDDGGGNQRDVGDGGMARGQIRQS